MNEVFTFFLFHNLRQFESSNTGSQVNILYISRVNFKTYSLGNFQIQKFWFLGISFETYRTLYSKNIGRFQNCFREKKFLNLFFFVFWEKVLKFTILVLSNA